MQRTSVLKTSFVENWCFCPYYQMSIRTIKSEKNLTNCLTICRLIVIWFLDFQVDELEKSRVSESVHEFLLTLCTSHKHGVIFRDPLVGLERSSRNTLVYTVLESMDRPWEHSYAGDLVTRICVACPDLAKAMWAHLKGFLEPRPTPQWAKAAKYAEVLVERLAPECIEFCAGDLNCAQVSKKVYPSVAHTNATLLVPVLKKNRFSEIEKRAVARFTLMILDLRNCCVARLAWPY